MSLDDLQEVLAWAATEGWNPGLADALAFHAADPYGFFVARVDGAPVAAVSVVNHDQANAFAGLYICRPEWRGKGAGLAVSTHGLDHAGARSIGLDGVPEQEATYRSIGFARVGQSLRYTGRWPAHRADQIRPVKAHEINTLIELDAEAGGFVRRAFMEAWLSNVHAMRESYALIQDGAVRGFATWRACHEGTKIGPVVAENTRHAISLIAHIAAVRPAGPLIIDVPEANHALRAELERADFSMPFATARMYRGDVTETGSSLQAIATMELG